MQWRRLSIIATKENYCQWRRWQKPLFDALRRGIAMPLLLFIYSETKLLQGSWALYHYERILICTRCSSNLVRRTAGFLSTAMLSLQRWFEFELIRIIIRIVIRVIIRITIIWNIIITSEVSQDYCDSDSIHSNHHYQYKRELTTSG